MGGAVAATGICATALVGCGQTSEDEPSADTSTKSTQAADFHLPHSDTFNDPELEKKLDDIWDTSLAAVYEHGNEGMGCVALAAKDGKVIFEKAWGHAHYYEPDYEADGSTYTNPVYKKIASPVEMTTDTLFDLASVTKVMATTQSIMILVDQGKLSVDDKAATYLPGFEKNGKGDITIAQLLTHSSGLPQWEPTFLYCTSKDEQLDYICDLELDPSFKTDGSEPMYSDFSFMTLGFIVEAITGEDMDAFVKKNVYEPLGMSSTGYKPLEAGVSEEKIAATSLGNPYEYRMVDEAEWPDVGYDCSKDSEAFAGFDGWRKHVLVGEVNDGNAGMGGAGVAGHAGLYSTASDLAILLQCMLSGSEWQGTRLYSADTVRLFTTRHTTYAEAHDGATSEDFGYAFKLQQSWMGEGASINCFGHDGFTGTTVYVDPDNQFLFVCLSNKMQAGFREPESSAYYNTNANLSKPMNQAVRDTLGI